MNRRIFLAAIAAAFVAGCAGPQERVVYDRRGNARVSRDQSRSRSNGFREVDRATRSIDNIVRRVQRWNR